MLPQTPGLADPHNEKLASACQQCGASCCRAGKIFLSPPELKTLAAHVATLSPAARREFAERLDPHEGFALYDQKDGCQFLSAAGDCTLHALGVKPIECLWWPYHVYARGEEHLAIEVATTCCPAWLHHDSDTSATFLDSIEARVRHVGIDMWHEFRRVHPGKCATLEVRRIVVAPVDDEAEGPPAPRRTGAPTQETVASERTPGAE